MWPPAAKGLFNSNVYGDIQAAMDTQVQRFACKYTNIPYIFWRYDVSDKLWLMFKAT